MQLLLLQPKRRPPFLIFNRSMSSLKERCVYTKSVLLLLERERKKFTLRPSVLLAVLLLVALFDTLVVIACDCSTSSSLLFGSRNILPSTLSDSLKQSEKYLTAAAALLVSRVSSGVDAFMSVQGAFFSSSSFARGSLH